MLVTIKKENRQKLTHFDVERIGLSFHRRRDSLDY